MTTNLQLVTRMKNALLALMLLLALDLYAQKGLYNPENELRGNGKSVQFTEPTKQVKEVEISPCPAQITIGANVSESIIGGTVDENPRPFLRLSAIPPESIV